MSSHDGFSPIPRTPSPLRLARLTEGLRQVDVASRAGITREWLSRLEREAHNPHLLTMQAIATALGRQIDDIFPYDERPPSRAGASSNTEASEEVVPATNH